MIMNRMIVNAFLLTKLAHLLVFVQNFLTIRLTTLGKRRNLGSQSMIRLGTKYGGWWTLRDSSAAREPRVLVSAGLGFDTSFDEAMLDQGYSVIGLDPLEKCCERASEILKPESRVAIYNMGISTYSGKQVFFEPKNPEHDSWSAINAQEVSSPCVKQFDVISLADLWSANPQIERAKFRYLKMDIEGAELLILQESLIQIADYDLVGVEMDFLSLVPFLKIKKRLNRVFQAREILADFENLGFMLIHVENFNFFWFRIKQ